MDSELIPWIFAAIMFAGVLYLLISIIAGELLGGDGDMDVGDMHVNIDIDVDGGLDTDGDGKGAGCTAIAGFLAGFGSMGLLGSLAGWNLFLSVIIALVWGYVLMRGVVLVLRFVYRQQSTAVITSSDLIGSVARITVNTPAGQTGEALLEGEQLIKYPVRTLDGSALQKGDYVEVFEVREGKLFVKKKREIE
jgi:membrane protein implicated in regulation of membrane protease activity